MLELKSKAIQRLKFALVFITGWCLVSCDQAYLPKPTGYNYIRLPQHQYHSFAEPALPYSFEMSALAKAGPDTSGNFKSKKEKYRILKYDTLNCSVHITYKQIDNSLDSLNSFINEAYRLVDGHDVKALGIKEIPFQRDSIYGMIFQLQGNVPSQNQFYAHDSTTHFLRGAVYFPVATKNDSLQPVIDYVMEDINHLISTIAWNKEL